MSSTIFALSTIFGKSGIAVIRISGPQALAALKKLGCFKEMAPRQAVYSKLFSLDGKNILDEGIIVYFQAPHSFTGEDVVELYLHGSIAVIKDVLYELGQLEFLRLAEPGEFTKRAFYNAKMDLTKAEAIADLIEAETTLQKNIALRNLSGELSALYEAWRQDIIKILVQLEALIDFPEDDISSEVLQEAEQSVCVLQATIKRYLCNNLSNTSLMSGIGVAIIGPPNAGKSTLLNALADSEVAIVSNIAGTTRDVIQVKIDLEGFMVVLSDTAGIRETEDAIEQEGVKRAKLALENSDIRIIVLDIAGPESLSPALSFLNALWSTNLSPDSIICVLNKIDLAADADRLRDLYKVLIEELKAAPDNILQTSLQNKESVELIRRKLMQLIKGKYHVSATEPVITKVRHHQMLAECVSYLEDFSLNKPIDIAAQDIRYAASALGVLTGKIDVEEVLDRIFSDFCIGK